MLLYTVVLTVSLPVGHPQLSVLQYTVAYSMLSVFSSTVYAVYAVMQLMQTAHQLMSVYTVACSMLMS